MNMDYNSTLAKISLLIVYGYDVKDPKDKYITLVSQAAEINAAAITPGAVIVNDLPFRVSHHNLAFLSHNHCKVRHFPGWLPGMGFQKLIEEVKHINRRARNLPFEHVKKSLQVNLANISTNSC